MDNTIQPKTENRLIRKAELLKLVPLSYNSITKLEGRGRFPLRIYLTGGRKKGEDGKAENERGRAVAWRLSDVLAWQKDPEGWGKQAA